MPHQLQTFNFQAKTTDEFGFPILVEHPLRAAAHSGEPRVVANDLGACLGIQNIRDAVAKLDADEKGVEEIYTPGGPQTVAVVTESGLYTLILRSHDALKPGTRAHAFRKWVTSEVLPSLRKHGRYQVNRPARVTASLLRETRLLVGAFPRLGEEARQSLAAHLLQQATGVEMLPRPAVERPALQMSDVAARLGVTDEAGIKAMGRAASKAGLRTDEYRTTRLTVLPCGKQVPQDHWYDPSGVDAVHAAYREWQDAAAEKAAIKAEKARIKAERLAARAAIRN